jgi:hypothetical protein
LPIITYCIKRLGEQVVLGTCTYVFFLLNPERSCIVGLFFLTASFKCWSVSCLDEEIKQRIEKVDCLSEAAACLRDALYG